ncbi:hypothetical protein [Streptomyces sp. NRRL S-87]|uniref:hypothetical protein n=1 Tax=Streptomyces sp. NRRL S-87 TaxID=1463920 RepID=UPI0004C1DA80|nr:hypothetical protein [Streptomyces sp. NRRL S-87]
MASGLLASAAVLFHVGTTDAFNALAYGGRVVGASFIVAALVELAAVVAACDFWGRRAVRYSGAVVLVGVGTVLVSDLMFLITQIEGRTYTPFLWLWVGLLSWVAWALWVLTRQAVWASIPHPRSIALSVVVTGVVGAAGVGYSQMYVPYSTPVDIPFGVSFGKPTASADGSVLHVPAHVEFRNAGSVRIYVVGTLWTVKGYPVTLNPGGNKMADWKRDMWQWGATLRHVSYGPSRMLGAGNFVDPGSRLDPGDDLSEDTVVDVPVRSGLGRVRIYAKASFVRADRGKLGNNYAQSYEASWDTGSAGQEHQWDAPGWLAEPGDEVYRYHSRVYHSSEMLNLTHAADHAAAWWVIPKWHEGSDFAKGDTSPYLEVSVSKDPEGEEVLDDAEQEPYGMTTSSRYAERTLDELLRDAKR